jgi:hypothetical protein
MVAARSAHRESFLRIKVVRKLRKDRPSNSTEEQCRESMTRSL